MEEWKTDYKNNKLESNACVRSLSVREISASANDSVSLAQPSQLERRAEKCL